MVQNKIQNYIHKLSETLFNELQGDEQLSLFLHSEESSFYRFNRSLVRQNSHVQQHELAIQFYKEERILKNCINLTLNLELDLKTALDIMDNSRQQALLMDKNPQFVKIKNNGHSSVIKKSTYPSDEQIPQIVHELFSDTDLAGLWCSGPLRQVSINSEGQFHFFETDFFFFDYSLYNGPLAAKGYYSENQFDLNTFNQQAQFTKNKLKLLSKPLQKISKGQYKVYLEPMAMAEILWSMGWSTLSQSQFNKGHAPLKKLKEKLSLFSSKVNFTENFELGMTPEFNSLGELSLPHIKLIENGHLNTLLISTATAQEYKLETNFADPKESPRSLELGAGQLQTDQVLQKLDTGLYLSNLHYINYSDIQSARITGMTRFASFWVEKGEIIGPIQDLRFDESLYNIFGPNLIDLTTERSTFVDIGTYQKRSLGVLKTPGALINNFNFTL